MIACKEYIHDITINYDGVDELWNVVEAEIEAGVDGISAGQDLLNKQMKAQLETKLKVKPAVHTLNKDQVPDFKHETTLHGMTATIARVLLPTCSYSCLFLHL